MAQTTDFNKSSTSLPSSDNSNNPPTYTSVVEGLTEPQQAYIAQQRIALENLEAKPACAASQNDIEAQRAAHGTSTTRQRRSPTDGTVRRRGLSFWKRISFCWLLFLLATLVPIFLCLQEIVRSGEPSIPPPYHDKKTWSNCVLIPEVGEQLGFWTVVFCWEFSLLLWGIFCPPLLARRTGKWRRFVEGDLPVIALGIAVYVGALRVWWTSCPLEMVGGNA